MSREDEEITKSEIDLVFFKVKTYTIAKLLVAGFIIWLIITFFFAQKTPGHWNEASNYETRVYVNLFTNKENSKNYRVVGEVTRYSDCEEDYGCAHGYYLTTAEFPNTGYIEFDECEVELNKKTDCTDTDGKDWYVELTNQVAE